MSTLRRSIAASTLAVVGAATAIAAAPPAAAINAEFTTADGFSVLCSDVGGTLQGYIRAYSGTATDLVIPESASDGTVSCPLTTIENRVFENLPLTSLTLPNSLQSIGTSAFAGTGLTSIGFASGASTLYIGTSAFADNALASLTIPDYVTAVGQRAFEGNDLGSVAFEGAATGTSRVRYIGARAFASAAPGSRSIGDITLPAALEDIAGWAFAGGGVTGVTFAPGSRLWRVQSNAFTGTTLTALDLPASTEIVGDNAFKGSGLSSLTLHEPTNANGRLRLHSGAFADNELTTVSIPAGQVPIYSQAFAGNVLESVTFRGALSNPFSGDPIKPDAFSDQRSAGGATFVGWFSAASGGTRLDPVTTVDRAFTMYAQTSGHPATIVFDPQIPGEVGITHNTTLNSLLVDAEPTLTREHYVFSHWETAAGDTWNIATDRVDQSRTLWARWIPNQYTVEFDTGTATTYPAQTVTYPASASAPSPAPTREHYSFGGWRDSAGDPWDFDDTVEEDATLTARWIPDTYTVSFTGEGTGMPADAVVTYPSTVTAPVAPQRTGYTFAGWEDAAGDLWDFDAIVEGDTTLVSTWTPNTYAVTFDAAGGTPVAGVDVTYPALIPEPAEPTREHYVFAGWVDSAAQPWDFTTVIAHDTTLTAAWTPLEYTMTFEGDGDGLPAPTTVTYPAPVLEPAEPVREHYVFSGWADAADVAWDFATVLDADVTLTSTWTPVDYTVTFDPANGAAAVSTPVTYPGSVTAPPAPFLSGHTFTGWTDSTGAAWDDTATVTGNTTAVATYVENTRTLSAPSAAQPGDSVTLTATGFDPNEPVEIEFHSTPVTLDTVMADATGAVNATVTIPANATPGEHELVLVAASGTVTSTVVIEAPPAAEPEASPAPTEAPSEELPATGPAHSWKLAAAAAWMAVAGALLIAFRRQH